MHPFVRKLGSQTGGTTTNLNGISCPSASTCLVAGDSGTILKTSNGGGTWGVQSSATTSSLRAVACVSSSACFAVGDSGTARGTLDGGTTWTTQTSGTTNALRAVACVSGTQCAAVGDGGTIVGTTTGGSAWPATYGLAVYYVGMDGHGSVVTLSDVNGAVQDTYRYDPYGNSLAKAESATLANPWQYAGGYLDAESGLYLLGARYYDPGLGRFLQVDPLDSGALSQYAYVKGDPCNNTDPTGMKAICSLFVSPADIAYDAAGVVAEIGKIAAIAGAAADALIRFAPENDPGQQTRRSNVASYMRGGGAVANLGASGIQEALQKYRKTGFTVTYDDPTISLSVGFVTLATINAPCVPGFTFYGG